MIDAGLYNVCCLFEWMYVCLFCGQFLLLILLFVYCCFVIACYFAVCFFMVGELFNSVGIAYYFCSFVLMGLVFVFRLDI